MKKKKKNYKKAVELFKLSANQGESWALNKLGQMYREGKGVKIDLRKAFEYYNKATEATIYSICFWSKYNLAHYFYENGLPEIGIAKDIELSISLLEECIKHDILPAYEDLIYLYFEKYISTSNTIFLSKAKEYANIYSLKDECDDTTIDRINNTLDKIKTIEKKKINL